MNGKLKAIFLGHIARFRVKQKLLQYLCKITPLLPDMPEIINIKLLDLINISLKSRIKIRKKGGVCLSNIYMVENLYFDHLNIIDQWNELEQSYFISNFVVKSWVHKPIEILNADISLILPSVDNFAESWKNGDNIILGYKGVKLLWGNLIVTGYFKDNDLTSLNSIFTKVRARYNSIASMLQSNGSYNKLNVDGYLKDLGPREILVADAHQIIWDYERLENNWKRVVNMPLTPLAKEVDKLSPYYFIQLIHSLMLGNHGTISREQTQCRLLYELICIKYNDIDNIIAICFPSRIRQKVCKRMIGITNISPKTHKKMSTNTDLPLNKKITIKFENYPKVIHAIRDRLREWNESRPGSDTHGKATQFLESLLLLPIGVFKRHPIIDLRLTYFGDISTIKIDNLLKFLPSLIIIPS